MRHQESAKRHFSREVLRHPEFADLVQLSRIRDHFICKRIWCMAYRTGLTLHRQGRVGRQYNPEELCRRRSPSCWPRFDQIEESLDSMFEKTDA